MECPVCYELVCNEDDREHVPECGHVICKSCMESWLDYSETCPMCRSVVRMPYEHHREFELVIVNEDAPELMSVFYPRLECVSPTMRHEQHPDTMIDTVNDYWERKGSMSGLFANDTRNIYFLVYMNGQASKKWYINDFSNPVRERLGSHNGTHHILHEMELILAETCIS